MQGKRLYRSRGNRVVAGVAAGLGETFNVDPVIVRLIFAALALMNGFGILLYLAMWLLIPNEDAVAIDARDQVRESVSEMQAAAESLVQRVRGMFNA
jgi:phage shock protein C